MTLSTVCIYLSSLGDEVDQIITRTVAARAAQAERARRAEWAQRVINAQAFAEMLENAG